MTLANEICSQCFEMSLADLLLGSAVVRQEQKAFLERVIAVAVEFESKN